MRVAVCAIFVASAARAEEPGDVELPLPKDSYFGLELDETDEQVAEARLRALVVYPGWFSPSLGPGNAVSGVRIEVPFPFRRDGTAGLGDINLLSINGIAGHAGGAGIGFAAVLPTAAPIRLGEGSVAIGPAAWGEVRATSWLDLAVLARELFVAIGSARTELKLKPAIVVDLPHDLFATSDAEMTFVGAFRGASIPANLKLGARFGSHVDVTFGPELVVAGEGRGALTLDLEVDVLP
jgi:hypothetical protein